MTLLRWSLMGVGITLLIAAMRVIVIGRKLPTSWSEERAILQLPKAYRLTQPGNRWQTRIPRPGSLRKRA